MNLTQLNQTVVTLSARLDGLSVGANTGTDVANPVTDHTTTSLATLAGSTGFPINGNDANVGTTYRLTAWGDLQTGSSATSSFRWGIGCFNATCLSAGAVASVGIGGAPLGQWPASSFLEWMLMLNVQVTGTGSSGSAITSISGNLAKFQGATPSFNNLGNLVGTNTVDSYALIGGSSATVNTTTGSTMAIQGFWGASNTGQRVRYFGSTFERLGP